MKSQLWLGGTVYEVSLVVVATKPALPPQPHNQWCYRKRYWLLLRVERVCLEGSWSFLRIESDVLKSCSTPRGRQSLFPFS